MYRDNTLIPTEAIRLAALGVLMEGDKPYAELASETRYFVERIIGPSLDLLGSSLELLRHEGLVEAEGDGDAEGDTILRISDAGRTEFTTLMTSNVRAPVNDVSRLVIALKMRFLHLLDEEHRGYQSEMLVEMCESELARLEDLRTRYGEGRLKDWLSLEIGQLTDRLAWFRSLV
jgi:DNA-binding PadR family transcriptional regulator